MEVGQFVVMVLVVVRLCIGEVPVAGSSARVVLPQYSRAAAAFFILRICLLIELTEFVFAEELAEA